MYVETNPTFLDYCCNEANSQNGPRFEVPNHGCPLQQRLFSIDSNIFWQKTEVSRCIKRHETHILVLSEKPNVSLQLLPVAFIGNMMEFA